MTSPKAVPATVFGRRFRSTTEARWAVFLTTLGVSWEYEPETYDLGDTGWYLPDFHMPRLGFLEVKGGHIDGRHAEYEAIMDRARALAIATDERVFVAFGYGVPTDRYFPLIWQGQPGTIEVLIPTGDRDHPEAGWDAPHGFCACFCGAIGIEFELRTGRLRDHATRCTNGRDGYDKDSGDTARLMRAYEAGAAYRPDRR